MRVASLPHYRPGQLIEHRWLWYALFFAAVLLAFGALVATVAAPSPPAETHLVGPFRWMVTTVA